MFGPSKRELLRVIERERIAFAQERAALIDRIAELAGRPLQPRRWDGMPQEPFEEPPERERILADPDQLPK